MHSQGQKVSVIIPTKDRVEMLSHSIAGVLQQTHQKFELLIIDDSKTQSAKKVVEEIALKDSRVKYFVNPGKGGNAARNKGIQESTASFLAFCDDDDVFHNNKIEVQLSYLLENNLDVTYCSSTRKVVKNGQVVSESLYRPPKPASYFFLPYLLAYSFISTQTILCTKKCVEQFGMFDENIPKGQDWDFCINLARNRCSFGRVSESLVDMYMHDLARITSMRSDFLYMIISKYKKEYRSLSALIFFLAYCIKTRKLGRLQTYLRAIF